MGITDACEASLLENAVNRTKESQHKGSLLLMLLFRQMTGSLQEPEPLYQWE